MTSPLEAELLAALTGMGQIPRGETIRRALNAVGDVLGAPLHPTNFRGPDYVIEADGKMPTAVEVRFLKASNFRRNWRNHVASLLAAAVQTNRAFKNEVSLSALILVDRTSASTDAISLAEIAQPLLQDEFNIGYQSLVVGEAVAGTISWHLLLSSDDGVWTKREVGTEQVAAALRSTATDTPSTPAKGGRELKRFLLVSDEWRSSRGGISTINRELAIALADKGYDVAVMVPHTREDDILEASDAKVTLVTSASVPGLDERDLLLLRPVFSEAGWVPDVVVGHGRILGPYAAVQQQQFFPEARRVHIVHMDASELEVAKERPGGESRMLQAEERRVLERELAESADLVVGIGPTLRAAINDDLMGATRHPRVIGITPGLRAQGPRSNEIAEKHRVLLVGRADDFHSKGIDLAALALVDVEETWPSGDPHRPTLVLRGVPGDGGDVVKAELEKVTGGRLHSELRPFSAEESDLLKDLAQAKVVLMPSRHEGFGLAAWEAIAAGIPVLVSDNSGLARTLREHGLDTSPSSIVSVRDSGARTARDAWSAAITSVLLDPKGARDRALTLRARVDETFSWSLAVDRLVEALM